MTETTDAGAAARLDLSSADLLDHYSAALNEIYRLRAALAIEARGTQAHLEFKGFPKSQRPYAERQIFRMRAAAAGRVEQAYREHFVAGREKSALREACAPQTLTRAQWEADRG